MSVSRITTVILFLSSITTSRNTETSLLIDNLQYIFPCPGNKDVVKVHQQPQRLSTRFDDLILCHCIVNCDIDSPQYLLDDPTLLRHEARAEVLGVRCKVANQ